MSSLPFIRLADDGDYLVVGPGVESDSFKLDNPVLDFSATDVLALQAGTGRFVVTSVTGGTGNVVGPVGATDNALARYDGATGTVIQNSVVTLSDAGALAGVASVNGAAVPNPIGDVVGPGAATANNFSAYADATGKLLTTSLWGQNTVLGAMTYSSNPVIRMNTPSGCFVGSGATSLAVVPGPRLTAIGAATGGNVTVGGAANTTLVGALAGQNLTTATRCTLVGESAGRVLTVAGNNTAVGSLALTNATGVQNTALGASALAALTTGTSNIGVGANAGVAAAVGANACIYLGHPGVGTDTLNVMRLGLPGTASTFVTGVNTAAGDGVNFVTCAATGQMGVSRLPWSYAGSIPGTSFGVGAQEFLPVGSPVGTVSGGASQYRVSYNFDLTTVVASANAAVTNPGGTLNVRVIKNNALAGTALTSVLAAGVGPFLLTQAQAVSFVAGDTIGLQVSYSGGSTLASLGWELMGTRY